MNWKFNLENTQITCPYKIFIVYESKMINRFDSYKYKTGRTNEVIVNNTNYHIKLNKDGE